MEGRETVLKARFEEDGIAKASLYTFREFRLLRKFLRTWIAENFVKQGINEELPHDLSNYHNWAAQNDIPHETLFSAPFRFCSPKDDIRNILLNKGVNDIFASINYGNLRLIDEGMGWLGYRIIRPGMGDGYPLSCKDWGASSGAFSFWVPIYGFGSKYALHYVRRSHLNNYQNFLPMGSKFTKDEFRLHPEEKVNIESQFVKPGSALFYHSKLIHTEDVKFGRKTRLNLEFRFLADKI